MVLLSLLVFVPVFLSVNNVFQSAGGGTTAKKPAKERAFSKSSLTYQGKVKDTVQREKTEISANEPSFLDSVFSHSGGLTKAESSAHSSRVNGRTEYYDRKSKKRIGSSVSYGGKTTYFDEKGRKVGTSSVSLNGTDITYRDTKGRTIGTARRNGRTTEYYDADKRPIGRSESGSRGEEFISYRRH